MSKKILSLLLAPVSILPITVASAKAPQREENQTNPQINNPQTNPGQQTPPANPDAKETPKKSISPAFSEFKGLAEKEINDAVANVIKEGKKILQALHDTAKKDDPKDFKANLKKIIYLKELIKYLSDENAIKKNPFDNGLPLIFPKVVGENRNLITAEADFNKNVYSNFWIGTTDYTDYKEAITGVGDKLKFSAPNKKFITEIKGTLKSDNNKSQQNVFTKMEFTDLLKKYTSDLLKESRKLFFDEKDIPEFELNYDDLNNLTWGKPKNFASWKDYIFTKLYPKVLDFDLKQNQQAVQKQNEEQNKKNPVNPPNIPPLVPGKPSETPPILDESAELEKALPPLTPYVSPEYATRSSSQLSSLFRSASEEEKQKIFFFNNPINTRYEYKVVSFSQGANDQLNNIKIYISDRVVKNLSRSYTIASTKLLTLRESTLKKAEVESITKIFQGVAKSIGYDDKLDYSQVNNATLQLAMFNLVKAANERILNSESPSFRESQDKLQNSYINLWKTNNDNNNLVQSYKYATELNFLGELSATKIDKGIFWSHLADAYIEVLDDLKIVIEGNKPIIEQNIQEINGNALLINQLFNMARQDSFKFKSLSNEIPVDRGRWYNSYILLSANIKNSINLLSSLIDREAIKGKAESKTKYSENYNKAQEVINLNQKQKNNVKNTIAYVIIAIGALIAIIDTVALIMKRKNLKNKQILALILIIYLCALVLVGAGIALLFV
ncbi:hypothetical protein HGG64_00830 [Mycoplasma phocoeninasale]|uniref:Transmembrane protein n=1 Tax=Mycoplasma phocoeninasale TaxID=2726117 RepID=A0A858U2I9_9MOLU|nr:hypothetical protein [Mycoplasma phocoeninasale]QJG66259.1 hypothetical protein HGG64_00830 [Mycoplasma phocoeninasale]